MPSTTVISNEETLLAEINLTGCPIGNVLDARDADQSINEKFFAGWRNMLTPHVYWNRCSDFRVVDEDG